MDNNMIKTPDELLNIMKAEAMGDLCFSHILDFIKVGMTEIQVADEIERVLLAMGAQGLSFPTICVSGLNFLTGNQRTKRLKRVIWSPSTWELL